MKFKATFSERGIRMLDKGFLPTLERFGKRVDLLLSHDELNIIMTPLNADGAHLNVRLGAESVYVPESVTILSKHKNLIAVGLDLAQLAKVFRGAISNDAQDMEVKLTIKAVNAPGQTEPVKKPFLSFSFKGFQLSMVNDLPVSKPMVPSEIDRLVEDKDAIQLCPYYLELSAEVLVLQNVVERLRRLQHSVQLATFKAGAIHLKVEGQGLSLGSEVGNLIVMPESAADEAPDLQGETAEERLSLALEAGTASAVEVPTSLLARTLQSTQHTLPFQVLLGIAGNKGHVHVLFAYRDPVSDDGALDDSVSFSCVLPVRDELEQ